MWYAMMIFAYIKSWPIQEILDSYTYRHTLLTHQMALVMDLPQVMLALKYFCSGQFHLLMELNRRIGDCPFERRPL
jgi:hypothetical protein